MTSLTYLVCVDGTEESDNAFNKSFPLFQNKDQVIFLFVTNLQKFVNQNERNLDYSTFVDGNEKMMKFSENVMEGYKIRCTEFGVFSCSNVK